MKNIKMLLTLAPVLFLVAACGEISSSSSESSSVNETSSSEASSSEASSSEGIVHVITTEAHLAAIANHLDEDYTLGANITLSGAWTPIGTQANPFTGTLDGMGYSINGLTMTAESIVYESVEETVATVTTLKGVGYLGLFGVNAGAITNMGVYGVDFTGTGTFDGAFSPDEFRIHVGALAGINLGTINHVNSTGNFSFLSTDARVRAGGLVGLNSNGTIQMSESSVNISVTTNLNKVATGGLVGETEGTTALLSRVKATGQVSATMNSADPLLECQAYAGGVVAVQQGGTVNDAFASGSVTSSINGAKPSYAGGVVGTFDNEFDDLVLSNAFASGTVSATSITNPKAYAGGILGRYEDKGFGHVIAVSNILSGSAVEAHTTTATKAYSGTLISDFNLTNSTLTNAYFSGTATFTGKSNGTLDLVGAAQTTLDVMTVTTMGWPDYWTIEAGVVSLMIPMLSNV